MRQIIRPWQHLPKLRNRGIAALEFGLLSPVFIIAFAGVIDLGDALYTQIRLESALAAGANYALFNAASVGSTDGATMASNIATLVTTSNPGTPADSTVVVNNGPTVTVTSGTSVSSGTAANADLSYCPTGSPPSWTWGSSVAAGSACTGGSTAGQFVTITASYSFTPLFPAYHFASNGTITVGVLVQTK